MSYPFRPGELRGKPLTRREEEIMVAVVNAGGPLAAARTLGLCVDTVKHHLAAIRDKVGATTTTHAAALLFPRLGDRYLVGPPASEQRDHEISS